RIFLPAVVTISLGTFLFWLTQGPWPDALFNAMAVLLVACPCAMGLATPIAVWSGLAELARLGVVARTGDTLDALARGDTVCIDKTGTLSEAQMVVTGWAFEPDWIARETWLRAAVVAVERDLPHPVAKALTNAITENGGGETLAIASRQIVAGRGVVANVAGHDVRIGEWSLLGIAQSEPAAEAKSIFVAVDGTLAATIALGERWREGMTDALVQWDGDGIAVEVLTGDPQPPPGLPVPVR